MATAHRAAHLLLIGLVLGAASAHAQDTARVAAQFWPELDVYYRVSAETRMSMEVEPTRDLEDGQRGDLTDLTLGAFFDVGLAPLGPHRAAQVRFDGEHRRKYLRLRVGGEYVSPPRRPGDRVACRDGADPPGAPPGPVPHHPAEPAGAAMDRWRTICGAIASDS